MKRKSVLFLLILIIFSNCKKEEIEKKYVINNFSNKIKIFENDSILEIDESEINFDTLFIDSTYTITKSMIFNIDLDLNSLMSRLNFYMIGTWTKRSNGTNVFTNQTFVAPQTNSNIIGALNTTQLFNWTLKHGDAIIGSKDWKNENMLLSSYSKYYIPKYNDSIVLDSISVVKENSFIAFRLQKQSNNYNYGWIEAHVIDYKKLVVNNLTYMN